MDREEAKTRLIAMKAKFEMLLSMRGLEVSDVFDVAIEALSTSEIPNKCEDAISRRAVLDGIDNYIEKAQSTGTKDDFISFEELVVKALPPVTPKQKMGRWILLSDKDLNDTFDFFYKGNTWMNYECSNCGHKVHNSLKGTHDNRTNYCPNCGAKMEQRKGEE